jgi:hypothetical protein
VALKDGELMAKGDTLRLECESGSHSGPQGGKTSDEQRVHAGRERYQPLTPICNGDKAFRISGVIHRRRTLFGASGLPDRVENTSASGTTRLARTVFHGARSESALSAERNLPQTSRGLGRVERALVDRLTHGERA